MIKAVNKSDLPGHNLTAIVKSLSAVMNKTALKRLGIVIPALLVMTGRVTMLGISRWCEKGGSYRTVQRFFGSKLLWQELQWSLIKDHLLDKDDVHLLAGDEVVVSKAGKKSYGLDRFFSSLAGRPIKSLCFFCLSLISVKQRCAYPLLAKQVIRVKADETAKTKVTKTKKTKKTKVTKTKKAKVTKTKTAKPTAKGSKKAKVLASKPAAKKRGRPKGSKNKDKVNVELSPYLVFVKGLVKKVLTLMCPLLAIKHIVFDGAYGNNNVMQLAQDLGLFLISKLHNNAALYLPFEGEQKAKGAKRIYGAKLDYQKIASKYLQSSTISKYIQTDIYQLELLHKLFSGFLNVVIIVKTNLNSKARSHVVLFSNDRNLSYDLLIDYYSLRFQIEFNFRDAKQFWGLEDFMSVKERPIHNAANLSLLMVNVSRILIKSQHQHLPIPDFSVLDLKAHARAFRYASEALKLLPFFPDPFLMRRFFDNFPKLGAIRRL